ncbi:hypothetical protein ACWEFL_02570 [Streptomyces sp. NPDC004838]
MSTRISECGYCGETQFTGWYSKSAPRDRYGRIDRDYLDSEPVAYCSEEHRDAADSERASREETARAVEAQGALPVPLGHAGPGDGPRRTPAEVRLDEYLSRPVVRRGCGCMTSVALGQIAVELRAELERLRARVAELRAHADFRMRDIQRLRDRVAQFESLDLGAVDGRVSAVCSDGAHPTWLRAVDDRRGCPWCRVSELEALTPTPIQTCRACGAGYYYGKPCSVCTYKAQVAAAVARADEFGELKADAARLEARAAGETETDPGRRAARRMLADRQSGPVALVEPQGCGVCGIPKRGHARQWTEAAGTHSWQQPTDDQVLTRMRARRAARKGGEPS